MRRQSQKAPRSKSTRKSPRLPRRPRHRLRAHRLTEIPIKTCLLLQPSFALTVVLPITDNSLAPVQRLDGRSFLRLISQDLSHAFDPTTRVDKWDGLQVVTNSGGLVDQLMFAVHVMSKVSEGGPVTVTLSVTSLTCLSRARHDSENAGEGRDFRLKIRENTLISHFSSSLGRFSTWIRFHAAA